MVSESDNQGKVAPDSECKRTYSYLRSSINRLLGVMGTSSLNPEEMRDDDLITLDPIGIISDSFGQVLEHLHEAGGAVAGPGFPGGRVIDFQFLNAATLPCFSCQCGS